MILTFISDFLKNRDVFGYKINFTIREGSYKNEQTSRVGGAVSLLIYIFLINYFTHLIRKMNSGSFDNVMQMEDLLDNRTASEFQPSGLLPYIEVISNEPSSLEYIDIFLI